MKRFVKKIRNWIRPKKAAANTMAEKTRTLRSEKRSDVERWSQNEQLQSNWNERTAILGQHVPDHSKVIEFGAGNMFLKDFLNDTIHYTPSDVVQRFPETLVCDLNELSDAPIDLKAYDVAIFSGVLEYVYDIEHVFETLAQRVHQINLSYCCSDIVKRSREKNGWLSDYTYAQLTAVFKKYQYAVVHEEQWTDQSLFILKKEQA